MTRNIRRNSIGGSNGPTVGPPKVNEAMRGFCATAGLLFVDNCENNI